jgi:NDP-sugar pyrophosphorylase family protein
MKSDVPAVILAGGRGTRLAPYTTVLPKPLMPIGDMPILELLIRQLARRGVRDITLAVGHLASLLQAYFGDGERFGVSVAYSHEDQPLGTAGPLRLVAGLDGTFLVMNGDLLTDLDFSTMIDAHRAAGAAATVGLYRRDVTIDLGVIHTDDRGFVSEYIEKPSFQYEVSMGVYVFEPRVLEHIPAGQRFDLPNLVQRLVAAGEPVLAYRHEGYWLDIGRPDDYQRAQDDYPALSATLLGR